MKPLTQAVALKQLAWHLEQLLALVKGEIHFHEGILSGTATCNHDHNTEHNHYHRRILDLLDQFKEWARDDLKETNMLIWDLPHDDWADDADGLKLRFQTTLHDGVHFKYWASQQHAPIKSALTRPPETYILAKIHTTKGDKDMMKFVSSTRMSHAMWFMQTEEEFEEAKDEYSKQKARDVQRKIDDARSKSSIFKFI